MSAQIKKSTYTDIFKKEERDDGEHSQTRKSSPQNVSTNETFTHPLSLKASASLPLFSPLYQQIKQLILKSLQMGEWQPGQAIPSEMDLAERFQVSQGTVRKAIDELSGENLLTRKQGVGTFVATHSEEQVQYRFLKLMPDSENSLKRGSSGREIISFEQIPAGELVARALSISKTDDVLCLRRVLSFSGIATILEDIWLPCHSFAGLTADRLNAYGGPMYGFFEKAFGIKMVHARERIKAVLPNSTQAELLSVSESTPVLSVERTAFTYNNNPMEFRQGLYLTLDCHYRNELN